MDQPKDPKPIVVRTGWAAFWHGFWTVAGALVSLLVFAVFVQSCTACRPLYPVEERSR